MVVNPILPQAGIVGDSINNAINYLNILVRNFRHSAILRKSETLKQFIASAGSLKTYNINDYRLLKTNPAYIKLREDDTLSLMVKQMAQQSPEGKENRPKRVNLKDTTTIIFLDSLHNEAEKLWLSDDWIKRKNSILNNEKSSNPPDEKTPAELMINRLNKDGQD